MAQPLTVIVALTGSLTFFKGINQTFFGSGVMLGRQTPFQGAGGGIHVVRLNFKTSRVGVYKCLSLIVGFAVTVAIWPREVVSCRDFILRTVATFWAMSEFTLAGPQDILLTGQLVFSFDKCHIWRIFQ